MSSNNDNEHKTATTCEVVLVGCGAPNRGMGWYHAEQLMKGKCPSAILQYIIEPWFLGAGMLLGCCCFFSFVHSYNEDSMCSMLHLVTFDSFSSNHSIYDP
jgi:hypothetical protein